MKGFWMVFTILLSLAEAAATAQEVEIDVAVVGTERAVVQHSFKDRDSLARLLIMQRRLVGQLLSDLGVRASWPDESKPLKGKGLETLERLGEALEAMDQGDYLRARQLLETVDLPGNLVQSLRDRLPEFNARDASDRQVMEAITDDSSPLAREYAEELSTTPDWRLILGEGQKRSGFPVGLDKIMQPEDFDTGDQAQNNNLYRPEVPVTPPQPQPQLTQPTGGGQGNPGPLL